MRKLNITKKEFKEAKNYIFTYANITKNGVTGWNFYLLNNKGIKRVIGGPCWNDKRGYYHNTAWGLDRALDILLSIAYSLGLNWDEVADEKLLKL